MVRVTTLSAKTPGSEAFGSPNGHSNSANRSSNSQVNEKVVHNATKGQYSLVP
jgi:hypothetical protein